MDWPKEWKKSAKWWRMRNGLIKTELLPRLSDLERRVLEYKAFICISLGGKKYPECRKEFDRLKDIERLVKDVLTVGLDKPLRDALQKLTGGRG